jgi:hypothetical protein
MNLQIEINPDALLGRKQLSEALATRGIPVAEATLASMASRGGGPPFSKFSQRVLYRWGDAINWAHSRLSPSVTSTSQLQTSNSRSCAS